MSRMAVGNRENLKNFEIILSKDGLGRTCVIVGGKVGEKMCWV